MDQGTTTMQLLPSERFDVTIEIDDSFSPLILQCQSWLRWFLQQLQWKSI